MTDATRTDAALTHVSTAALLDVNGYRGFLGSSIVRRTGGTAVGTALTVRTGGGDNLALHHAVAAARPGDVVIVSCPGPPVGLAGEVIATALHVMGAAGFVTDSGVRDVDELRQIGLPVWSGAHTPRGTTKTERGTVGEPIEIGGVRVVTGDVIVADGDGVVCVPRSEWHRWRAEVERKQALERVWLAELHRGASLGALTGLVTE